MSSTPELLVGRFELERALRTNVWRGRDRLDGAEVLIKRFESPMPLGPEVSALGRLRSKRLPGLRDLGLHKDAFMVVDWTPGTTLDGFDMAPLESLGDVAEGLHVLHQAGLRHGDLSAANIVLTPEGRGALIDLGGAVPLRSSLQVGTPGYVAPELVEGRVADGRADLYALGRAFAGRLHGAGASLVDELCAPVERRISSAAALLERLGRAAPRPGTLVGRDGLLAALHPALRTWCESGAGGALALIGAPGSGKSRLLAELKLFAQQSGARAVEMPGLRRGWEGLADAIERPLRPQLEDWALASGFRVAVFADDVAASRLDRYVRAMPPEASLLLVATSDAPVATCACHAIAPLSPSELQHWDPALSVQDAGRLHALTGGFPADVEVALRGTVHQPRRTVPDDPALRQALAELVAGPAHLETHVFTSLEALGLVRRVTAGAALRRPSDADWLREALPDETAAAHRRAAAHAKGPALARHRYFAGDPEGAHALARDADFAHDPEGWRAALQGWAGAELQVRALREAGQHAAALTCLEGAAHSADFARERALALLGLGRIDEAVESAQASEDAPTIARVRFRAGDFSGALSQVEHALDVEIDAPKRAALLETRGAALAYLDERLAAEAALDAADAAWPDRSARTRARRWVYRGIAASRAADPRAAAMAYERALTLSEDADLADLRATAAMNLATAQQQLGRWGDALRGYERAHRLCRALAQGTEASKTTVAILRFNLANLHLACGDDARASYWLDDADEAEGALRAALLIARGERHELRGERAAAEAAFREAADSAQADAPREYIEARQKLGDACVREAEALGAIDLRARAALIGAKAQPSPLDAVREAQRLAEASADRALQAEIAGRAASMLRELGADAAADEWAERARLLWDEILLSLDREAAEAFKAHPLRVGLRRRQRPSESGEGDAQALRRILQINRKLNSNLPTSALLEHALDAAIELSRAERGFVLLAEAPMRVATARNMDRDRLRQPALRFSRSIAEEVVESRAPVLTTNAREDPRYVQQRSVLAMGLQSVACVPIESPDGVLGALYVDHRFLPGHFNAATLERLMLLADQVALALQGAQLRAQLEEKAARLEQEVAQRTSRLKAQEAALSASETALARITGGREARTDHAPLIGRSAAMHRVFDMLDRLKGRAVSVLIEGESGVGKELVARALHHDDALPFKAVNCAALPEALLESQLFGHRRGAFTGATDHREGLFVAAGEGSVLLDEVGELALPMQAKLLRALQEREVLPVGADAHRPFAARVLAATNRDLREEVADGRFREDLYYRLAVVTLPVPALRERTDDVPLLCEALLARAAEEQRVPAKPLSEGALRTILTHPWPGNVRELANVLRRALIFAPGPSIEADDLELGMPPSAAPQSRDAFEQDEAARIGAVLQDVGWNVSEASRRLAMPRNTLYRRMKKYGLR